jgi:hypothetical protein
MSVWGLQEKEIKKNFVTCNLITPRLTANMLSDNIKMSDNMMLSDSKVDIVYGLK